MGEPSDGNVRNIGLKSPFHTAANRYFNAGWWPIVIPYGLKHPPPTGFTGRNCQWPDEEQIAEWNKEGDHNVAFHLGPVVPPSVRNLKDRDPEWTTSKWESDSGELLYTVVGIDVDHYDEGDKSKVGHDQLLALEEKLGKLPETWTSSSRDDGKSGIRYFLAPIEYAYRGAADKHIDVIQESHRYAMAWPSLHPKGGQYKWFAPGHDPQGQPAKGYGVHRATQGKSRGMSTLRFTKQLVVPFVWALPMLPKAWIDHLTDGFTLHEGASIDLDISVDGVHQWALDNFNKNPEGEYCSLMRKRVEALKEAIREDATSHDKIRDAHMNVYNMGAEGHSGWKRAVHELENFWLEDVGSQGKRGLSEAKSEMFRSGTNALRKIKAKVDEKKKGLISECGCYTPPPPDELDGEFKVVGEPKDPGEYEMNDVGNGEHFIDLYGGCEGNFRFINKIDRWMVWTDRWSIDEEGDLAFRAFNIVQKRQTAFAEHLKAQWAAAKAAEEKEEAALLSLEMKDWRAFARQGGNVGRVESSLKAARDIKGVRVPYDLPDSKLNLLGVDNGVIELNINADRNEPAFILRPVEKDDWVLTNTGIPYLSLEDQLKAGGELAQGVRAWADYLEIFLPDPDVRAWTQQLLGYCLFGRNVEKKFVFLFGGGGTGKSTILNAVMRALGKYAGSFELGMFASERFNPALLRAFPMRIVTTTEAGGTVDLNAEAMKRITGNDPMSPERKGTDDVIEMTPAFVPIVGTNRPPHLGHIDQALQNRLEVIPFDVAMPTSEAGTDLIEEARHAVLAWLLEGWDLYVRHRLKNKPVAKLREAHEAFSLGMAGTIGQFLSDCCVVTGNHEKDFVPSGLIYEVYKRWCVANDISEGKRWSQPTFNKNLEDAGVLAPKSPRRMPGYKSPVRVRTGVKMTDLMEHPKTFRMNQ